MNDSTKEALVETAKAIPGAAVKATVQTAVEVTLGIAVLAAFGYAYSKVQERRLKKTSDRPE